ncbi:MAG: hypothetical protein MHM6MM_000891 [Cercozoa sp. M6MM]
MLLRVASWRGGVRCLSAGPAAAAPSVQAELLQKSLEQTQKYGFTRDAIDTACRLLDLSPASHALVYDHSRSSICGNDAEVALVHEFMRRCNCELEERMQQLPVESMRVTDIVRTGLRMRLGMIAPVLPHWPRAMALGALPSHAPETARLVAEITDIVWRAVDRKFAAKNTEGGTVQEHQTGKDGFDISFYTKRGMAGAVYAATELFMLSDASTELQDTWHFLDRRLDDVLALGKAPEQVRQVADFAFSAAQAQFASILSKTTSTPQ